MIQLFVSAGVLKKTCITSVLSRTALLQRRGQRALGAAIPMPFSSLPAEAPDTQAVVFKIPETVCSSLDELHFPAEA